MKFSSDMMRKLTSMICVVLCVGVLQANAAPPPLPAIEYKNQLLNASSSDAYWAVFETWISKSILANVYGESNGGGPYRMNRLERDSAFRRDLIEKFGFTLEGENRVPEARTILAKYNASIDHLVESGAAQEAEVLRPVVALRTPEGELITRAIGEPIPKGTTPQGVLPDNEYFKLLASGRFPIGDSSLTPTDAPTFIHDLGHLGGFLENPHYMALVRKYAELIYEKKIPSLSKRGYFFNEGLTLLNPRAFGIVNRTLALSPEMRKNPQNVSIEDMNGYLKTLGETQLRGLARALYSIVNHPRIIQVLGGAGREPFSANGNAFHNPFSHLSKGIYGGSEGQISVLGLAKVQLALIKMQEVSADDWFATLLRQDVSPRSPVKRLLESGSFTTEDENVSLSDFFREFGVNSSAVKSCEAVF